MGPGESVAVNRLEAKLLTSESFRDFAPASLLDSMTLEPSVTRPRLIVPGRGGELAEVLRDYAVYARIDPEVAIVAVSLAEAVEEVARPRPRRRAARRAL